LQNLLPSFSAILASFRFFQHIQTAILSNIYPDMV